VDFLPQKLKFGQNKSGGLQLNDSLFATYMYSIYSFFRKYWIELLVFAGVLSVYLIDLNPGFTFMNKAADSMGYIYSAKYLFPSYQTSPPLFLLLGHLFLMIPVGTEAWRMAFMSLLASMITCLFVYLIVKKMTSNKWYAVIGVAIFGLAAIVVSTTSIVETYPLVTMFATGFWTDGYTNIGNGTWVVTKINVNALDLYRSTKVTSNLVYLSAIGFWNFIERRKING
jgi:Dolichyl-phosphate-mannose-protein mannosyltransferase